jgi:hypothetical protein
MGLVRLLAVGGVMLVGLALGAAPAMGQATIVIDDMNAPQGNLTAAGPYASAGVFDQTTGVFDNSGYTLGNGEEGIPANALSCGHPPPDPNATWGSKSAWVRFSTRVAGRVKVIVDSSVPGPTGYDVFFILFTFPGFSPAGLANDLRQETCYNRTNGMGLTDGQPDESPPPGAYGHADGYAVPANHTIYLETLSVCHDGGIGTEGYACTDNERDTAPGGQTTIRFIFTPDNRDGDTFADTLDACPDNFGTVNGCPDADGDGYTSQTNDSRYKDCDDGQPTAHPGGIEVKGNNIDEDCNGVLDRDGDNYNDAPLGDDCDPYNAAVHPGARDRPGNGIDEDCNGRDARFPRVNSEVAPTYLAIRGRTVGFAKFGILPARKGMTIRIECSGRGCPYAARATKVRRSTKQLVLPFKRVALAVRSKVTVKIMRRGYIGRVIRFTIRAKRGAPRVEKLCLRPGTTRPVLKSCG